MIESLGLLIPTIAIEHYDISSIYVEDQAYIQRLKFGMTISSVPLSAEQSKQRDTIKVRKHQYKTLFENLHTKDLPFMCKILQ